jgi:hypothetical protein
MTIGAGPFDLYIKPNGGAYSLAGCVEKGFELLDGHRYYEIRCDNATGEAVYDMTYRGRMPIDLQFVLNNVINDEFDKIYAQWSAHYTELGTQHNMGKLASGLAFSAYLLPVTGSLWRAHSFPYIVFPYLCWTPDFQIRWQYGSKPTSLPVSWRALRYDRTYSAVSYSAWYHRASSAPT